MNKFLLGKLNQQFNIESRYSKTILISFFYFDNRTYFCALFCYRVNGLTP